MVKVSVIVSDNDNVSNQTFTDYEVVDKFESAVGDYVYFKNHGDVLDPDLLEIAYNACKEKDYDFVVFNAKNHNFKEIDEGIYSAGQLGEKLFTSDLFLSSKLIKRSFISNEFDLDDLDLLNWDLILNSNRFTFINKSLYVSNKKETDVSKAIDRYNRIAQKCIDKSLFVSDLRHPFYNYKIEALIDIYENSDNRQEIYELLKEDFTNMVYHPKYADFSANTTVLNKFFFDNIVYTHDFDEFSELMEKYYIKLEIKGLRKDIEDIRNETRNIRNETRRLNKMNKEILDSNSWKFTKPIRDIKRAM